MAFLVAWVKARTRTRLLQRCATEVFGGAVVGAVVCIGVFGVTCQVETQGVLVAFACGLSWAAIVSAIREWIEEGVRKKLRDLPVEGTE